MAAVLNAQLTALLTALDGDSTDGQSRPTSGTIPDPSQAAPPSAGAIPAHTVAPDETLSKSELSATAAEIF